MADIIFPDIAGVDRAIAHNALARQALGSNALRDQLLGLQFKREQDIYQRDVEGRALFPKAMGGDAQAANQLAGVNPELYGRLVQIKQNTRAEQWDLLNKRSQLAGQTGAAILSLPPEQRAGAWVLGRQRLLGSGMFQPTEVPEQYDEVFVSTKAREAMETSAIMRQLDETPRLQMPGGGLVPINQYRPQAGQPAPAPASSPAPPATPPVRAAGPGSFGPGLSGGVIDRIVGVESGGNPQARNPRSSATGPGQFINDTWLTVIKTTRPDIAAGRSDAELLSLRTDPALARDMTMAYADMNRRTLSDAGLPVTPGTTYLAHFAGPGGARAVLSANPNTPVAQILGPKVVSANPFLVNMTAGQLVAWADRKMAGAETSPQRIADVPGMVAPANTASLPSAAFSPGAMGGPPPPPQFTTPPVQAAPAPAAPSAAPGLIPMVDRRGLPFKTENMPTGMRPVLNPATGQVEAQSIPGADAKEKREAVNKLADDWRADKNVQRYQTVAPIMASVREAIKRPGGAADLNIIYAMAKLMDPESVVREGETIMVTKSGGPIEQIRGLIESINAGQRLTDNVRQQLMVELESRTKGLKASYDRAVKYYAGRAKRLEIDPEEVMYDPGGSEVAPPPPMASGSLKPGAYNYVPGQGLVPQ